MTRTLQIPPDVWFEIGRFLPNDDLSRMLEVNSSFFNLSMNARYYNISLIFTSGAWSNADRVFCRLQYVSLSFEPLQCRLISESMDHRNPSISKRVRKISVTWTPPPEVPWENRMLAIVNGVKVDSLLNTIDEVVDLFPRLRNILGFHFSYRSTVPTHEYLHFLECVWMEYGTRLRDLSIQGYIWGLEKTLPSAHWHFRYIQEIHVDFEHDHYYTSRLSTIPVLINSMRDTLESLIISSINPKLALNFLDMLGPFPLLRSFELLLSNRYPGYGMPPNPNHFTNKLLRSRNGALKDVSLGFGGQALLDERAGEYVMTWIDGNMSEDPSFLANLQSLHISTPINIEIVLERSSNTLQCLYLKGCGGLVYDQVAFVLGKFMHRPLYDRLEILHLGVFTLSVQLLDSLAGILPGLHELSLFINGGAWEKGEMIPGEQYYCTPVKVSLLA